MESKFSVTIAKARIGFGDRCGRCHVLVSFPDDRSHSCTGDTEYPVPV